MRDLNQTAPLQAAPPQAAQTQAAPPQAARTTQHTAAKTTAKTEAALKRSEELRKTFDRLCATDDALNREMNALVDSSGLSPEDLRDADLPPQLEARLARPLPTSKPAPVAPMGALRG